MAIPDIGVARASYINLFLDVFEDAGMPVERWMDKARLPECVREMPDVMVPDTQSIALIEFAEAHSDISDVAFRAARGLGLNAVSQGVKNCVLGAPTLFAALKALSGTIFMEDSHLRFWMTQDASDNVRVHSAPESGSLEPYSNWLANYLIISVTRHFISANWTPDHFAMMGNFPPGHIAREAFPNTRFLVEQPTAYVDIPAAALHFPPRIKQMPDFLGRSPLLEGTTSQLTFSNYLRSVVKPHLYNGTAQIRIISELLGVSERTLQRRLRLENKSFRDIVNETRLQHARDLLSDESIQIIEIAISLGYENATHFSRAFRSGNGLSPSQFRRQMIEA